MAKKKMIDYKALKRKLEDAKEKISDLEANFESKVEEHPIQSVAIAFGVGILTGAMIALLSRRSK